MTHHQIREDGERRLLFICEGPTGGFGEAGKWAKYFWGFGEVANYFWGFGEVRGDFGYFWGSLAKKTFGDLGKWPNTFGELGKWDPPPPVGPSSSYQIQFVMM